jgi:septum formation protein
MKLILGSSSKYRKEILEKAGYVFDILVPDVDEKNIKTDNPYERSLILARAKADAILEKVTEPSIIITSDSVVICDGKLYEKPVDETEARKFLNEYSHGANPEIVCALVVVNSVTGERYDGVDITKVFFKSFTKEMIENFIKEGKPLERAGGFAIQHPIMKPFVDKIEGTEESIIGVPLHLLKELLEKVGYLSKI